MRFAAFVLLFVYPLVTVLQVALMVRAMDRGIIPFIPTQQRRGL